MVKKTKQSKQTRRSLKYLVIPGAIILLITVLSLVFVLNRTNVPSKPISRAVLELAEAEVRSTKPAPTLAALQYAYIASGYADALQEGDQAQALYTSQQLLQLIYPEASFDEKIAQLTKDYHLKQVKDATVGQKIVSFYKERYVNDGHDLQWDGSMPSGSQYWHKTKADGPFTPRAGEWKRWNVREPIAVPAPPLYGSEQDAQELQKVQIAVANRSGEDVNKINFWGGTPGTDSPSGIWQNQLYALVQNELSGSSEAKDAKYALIQKNLSQSISDAFMECWKVKYTYWTARPSMRIPGLPTSMPDPYFPSYISGHSTISKAAADVLSVMVPDHTDQWQKWAAEARDSRLSAGVHFEIDNTIGFQLGADVAQQEIDSLRMTKEL